MAINRLLRDVDKPDDFSESLLETIEESMGYLDKALRRARLPEEVVVYRGLRDYKLMFNVSAPEELVGEVFTERAYTSTTLSRATAEAVFAGPPHSAVLELTVPKGHSAGWLPAVTDYLSHEEELLLPTRTSFRVFEAAMEGGILMIRAEVLTS